MARPALWRMVGATLIDWMESALIELQHEERRINEINVFPVPDGDTGHNMVSTLKEALHEVRVRGAGPLETTFGHLADGALMGARGNSGVILSQLLAGFAEASTGHVAFGPSDMKRGFALAAKRARLHVAHPVEGTVLTVADAMAKGAGDQGDLVELLQGAIAAGEAALQETPRQLPQLALAGTVDAGALGYLTMVRGWLKAALGEQSLGIQPRQNDVPVFVHQSGPVEFFYDVEALLYQLRRDDAEDFLLQKLQAIGDSIVVAPGSKTLKVHVHTNQPVALMEILTAVGDIRQMEWLDMRYQVSQRNESPLTIVAPPEWHPLFMDGYRVLDPKFGVDQPHTIWIMPHDVTRHALAVHSLGMAGQLVLEYDPLDSWETNCSRFIACLGEWRHWVIDREGGQYQLDGMVFKSAETLSTRLKQNMESRGIVTIYLSQDARREEAAFWQDALNAALVPVPHQSPWMEIVWQP